MANKLKVDELRAKLAERGLSTIGLKSVLVERLNEAIIADANKKKKDEESKGKRKWNLDSLDGNENDSNKLIATAEFRDMNVKQLREEANKRGLVSTGTKKELLERLCNVDKGFEEEKKEDKIVTATKKGAAVLDQWIPDIIKNRYHVLQRGDDVYDAMLNQTNIRKNNNKFFVLQVLESDNQKTYMVYVRRGRVGVKGLSELCPLHSCDQAIQRFAKKFFKLTKNHWSERKNFVPYPKLYTWIEMDYGKEEEKDSVVNEPEDPKLDPRVAKFVSLIICNVNMMTQQMMEIGYNANKLPLGKLSKSMVSKGYEVLKRLSEVIERYDSAKIEELSGEFYTVIPHDFGYKKMSQFVINTRKKLKQKIEMVEALGEIELATKLLSEYDHLYYPYQQLNCGLTPVESDSDEFSMVAKYMENTHSKLHSRYTAEMTQLFRASRAVEADRFQPFSSSKNRMLLWHGSRLTNWAGILSQAPPEAPSTGRMFGRGVYFADMFSKSANYCHANFSTNDGVLLLCKVALGDMNELYAANLTNNLPPGKLSTKGVGSTISNPKEAKTLEDGVVVPLGKPVNNYSSKGTLMHNEYIVYNEEQIKMRYVVQVKFKFHHNKY